MNIITKRRVVATGTAYDPLENGLEIRSLPCRRASYHSSWTYGPFSRGFYASTERKSCKNS